MRVSDVAQKLGRLEARREITAQRGQCTECRQLTRVFAARITEHRDVGIGTRTWWTDPAWSEGNTMDRKLFVLTKLRTLGPDRFQDVGHAMFRNGVDPDAMDGEQWLDLLLSMGATPNEARDVLEGLGFRQFRIGG